MPLHRGAPRAPTVRWALRWLERKRLMAEIIRGMQLMHDDRPFIVLTETKLSKRHIPVWARYSPLRTRVEAHANTLSP
jgi:hypothetical protein